MTLDEWLEFHPEVWPVRMDGGGVKILSAHLRRSAKRSMFRLSDYVVSSAVSGPAYILAPKGKDETHH